MSNPPGGNGAPNFLNLNLGVGVGGLQGNFLGAGRGDAPPVVALAHILRLVRGREESGQAGACAISEQCGPHAMGRGCRRTGGGAAAACARAGKHVRPAAEMPTPHAAMQGCQGRQWEAHNRCLSGWGSGAALAHLFCLLPRSGQDCQVRTQLVA